MKVLHPVPIHFKGSGFYSTDYGRASRKRDVAEGDGGGSAKKDEKAEKVESKDKKSEKKAAADSGS